MTKTEAKKVIDAVWYKIIDLVSSKGKQETRYYLAECLKAEKREKMPETLAKARLVQSVWSGGDRPNRNIGDLYGVRDAHVKAIMIGARFKFRAVDALEEAMLEQAADVLFRAWQVEQAADVLFRAWQVEDAR